MSITCGSAEGCSRFTAIELRLMIFTHHLPLSLRQACGVSHTNKAGPNNSAVGISKTLTEENRRTTIKKALDSPDGGTERMNKAICFVDDDEDEVRRFRESMQGRYVVGAATTLDKALSDLVERRASKPDLFLLDLYYGPETSQEMRGKIAAADEKLTGLETEMRALLLEAKQSPEGGFHLAEEVNKRFPRVPRVFFSRKAFLSDALRAQERGFAVLEKPDPDSVDEGTAKQRYDAAFRRHSDQIGRAVDRIVNLNTWWVRNRQKVEGFLSGFFFFLLKVGWDFWKGNSLVLAAAVWFLAAVTIGYALFLKRP
jgi:CheY-like chemotaxis protein